MLNNRNNLRLFVHKLFHIFFLNRIIYADWEFIANQCITKFVLCIIYREHYCRWNSKSLNILDISYIKWLKCDRTRGCHVDSEGKKMHNIAYYYTWVIHFIFYTTWQATNSENIWTMVRKTKRTTVHRNFDCIIFYVYY